MPGSEQLFNISPSNLKEILSAGIDLNCLFLLEHFSKGLNINLFDSQSERVKAWKSTLIRKDLLSEDDKVTNTGYILLGKISGIDISSYSEIIETSEELFEQWWKTYPRNDMMPGFPPTRTIRVDKQKCQSKFLKIINEGTYSGHDLIRALEREINQRKLTWSIKREQTLTYMKNSLSYLNQRAFEGFIDNEEMRETKYIITPTDTTDI
jgi:hypothetical protein